MTDSKVYSEQHRAVVEAWIQKQYDGSYAGSGRTWPRLSFQDALALTEISAGADLQGRSVKRFVSRRPAWKPGGELPWDLLFKDLKGPKPMHQGPGVFGGVVYAQAPLAAARAIEAEDIAETGADTDKKPRGKLGIHSIQGVFTSPGLRDRPFIFEVSPLSTGKSFATRLVNVRQPTQPSEPPTGPFSASDADKPLKNVCFSCMTTFKRSAPTPDDVQTAQSPQQRYADILSKREPHEWPMSPQSDVDLIRDLFPHEGPGAFPVLNMHKVDMTEYNESLPVPERRELIYYRLLEPLPGDDVNAHIVCHAFEADRNGLIMLGNHIGYGYGLGRAASLSYSFYVHVNPEEAVMGDQGWWLQEVSWPRVSAGRCMMECRIWSPQGRHVASAYQDGMILPSEASKL
ncbi:hypothetical protein CDD82_4594 [Ophiocordyceps australis]|uniref:Acyl-CoA thioesterase II n=1 Tax=Ophiocordyceps australis TaxID=1399860 RepID=A0A2C5Z276_9HYPO|nr:hypothetical protein CDD82_4594 [Ophiocordyceps australis]